MSASVEDRFWVKVAKGDGCWEWMSSTDGRYGQFWLNGRHVKAHRVSYEWENGPIPEGLVIDHLCFNTRCVRPSHLRAVTNRVNLLAGRTIVAVEAARTECVHGHPLTGANLRTRPNGWRQCRTCLRARQDQWLLREKRRRAAKALSLETGESSD